MRGRFASAKDRCPYGQRFANWDSAVQGVSDFNNNRLCFAYGAEDLHLLLDLCLDSLGAGSEQLSGVEALALLVLACLDISAGSLSEYELALRVDVDLADAQRDRLLDHVVRDTGAAVQNEGHVAGLRLDRVKSLEGETRPVLGIYAVDVADTGSQHGNAQISDHLALFGISALAHADNAVFLAADGADLSLDGQTQIVADTDQLFGLGDVLFDRLVRAVEHDGREARFDALLSALIGAVIEVERYGNGDAELFDHTLDHTDDGLVAAHILARALGYAEDDRGFELLSGQQDRLGPLKVVDVELTDSIVTGLCFGEHFFCVN